MWRFLQWLLLAALVLPGLLPQRLDAQPIPKEDYIQYLPLSYAQIKRQADATAALTLYGDPDDPAYRDVEPLDGIDDQRHDVLMDLAVRFAPYMVQNTTAIPMDHKKFFEQSARFPLYVDTWDIFPEKPAILSTDAIDFVALATDSCEMSARARPDPGSALSNEPPPPPVDPTRDDCRLLGLLDEFHPEHPTNERFHTAAVAPDKELFKVMYFDYPGYSPKTWREVYRDAYTDKLPLKYHSFIKSYVHPFIHTIRSLDGEARGYELVYQYWFFYAFNDGGNNHEGDWEHINVVISPRSRIGQHLGPADIEQMMTTGASGNDPLVISRVEYGFHHKVMTLDYAQPNVYLPREAWEDDIDHRTEERASQSWFWRKIRWLAYHDDAETDINTHPVVYIGADNKGLDQLLNMPGGVNRDAHGNYPFPGLYKGGGPSLAAEQIETHFDHRAYARKDPERPAREPAYERGNMVPFDDRERLELVPDWERVIDLMDENPEARREWSWLVLPIRWGFPATASPGAGIVKNADTGNTPPLTPTYIPGWNVVGPTIYSEDYDPHLIPAFFPQQWQDNFINSWGILNLTLPSLVSLPPFDIGWRILSSPLRVFSKQESPIFYPVQNYPFRFIGISSGVANETVTDDFLGLLNNQQQFDELLARQNQHLAEHNIVVIEGEPPVFDFDISTATAPFVQVSFYLGERFQSQNTIHQFRHKFTGNSDLPVSYIITSELNLWEYAGSMRYNLLTGNFRPSLMLGYGLSWYRMEETRTNGELLDTPNSPFIRLPSFEHPTNFLPNTWHWGLGLEFISIKSFAPPPKGIDVSLGVEYRLFYNNLGLDFEDLPVESFIRAGFSADRFPQNQQINRSVFHFVLTVSL